MIMGTALAVRTGMGDPLISDEVTGGRLSGMCVILVGIWTLPAVPGVPHWLPVAAVLGVVSTVSALPLDFHGKLRVLRAKLIPAALRGVEASLRSHSRYLRLRAAFVGAVRSRRVGTALRALDAPEGADPGSCSVRFSFVCCVSS